MISPHRYLEQFKEDVDSSMTPMRSQMFVFSMLSGYLNLRRNVPRCIPERYRKRVGDIACLMLVRKAFENAKIDLPITVKDEIIGKLFSNGRGR